MQGAERRYVPILLALALTATGCAGQDPGPAGARGGPSRPGELVVGTTANYPPIIFKQGEEIQGVEADIARRLAQGLRLRLTFVELAWAGLMGLFTPLTEEHLAFAVRKADESLRGKLNAELALLRERGELSAILARWIPVRIEVSPAARP